MPPAVPFAVLTVLVMMPVTMPVPVLRGIVLERFDVSEQATSLFMSVNMIGAFLTAPLAGMLADRFGRQRAMIAAALAVDAALMASLRAGVPFGVFMTLRFLEGCSHIFALSLVLSLAAERARSTGRARLMGVVGASLTLGIAVGTPLGGVLGKDDPLQPLLVGSLILVTAAVLAPFVLPATRGGARRPPFRAILPALLRERSLFVPLAFGFVDRFTVGFFTTTFPLYLGRIHELPSSRIGLLLALFLLPFSLLSYPFGRLSERTSRTLLVGGGSLIYGCLVMSLGWWSADALPVLMLMLGVFSAVMFVPSILLTTDVAARTIRSSALGCFNAAGSLGFILGPIVGGSVSETVAQAQGWQAGYTTAFVIAGAAEIACVVVTLLAMRRLVRGGRTT